MLVTILTLNDYLLYGMSQVIIGVGVGDLESVDHPECCHRANATVSASWPHTRRAVVCQLVALSYVQYVWFVMRTTDRFWSVKCIMRTCSQLTRSEGLMVQRWRIK